MGNEQLIIEYIKKYIVSDVYPDSAIMINGGWGSGKTYFIKNILVSNLEETLKIKEMHLSKDMYAVNGVHVFLCNRKLLRNVPIT